MKRLISILLVVAMACVLAACAGSGNSDKIRVKCPACGYEFEALSGE